VALNILKVVIEHQIEDETGHSADDVRAIIETNSQMQKNRRRWYDVNETLRAGHALAL
jgi:hypothetical protein